MSTRPYSSAGTTPQVTPQRRQKRMKRTFLLLTAAVLASAAVVVTAGAAPSAAPGVAAKSIMLEGTFPLSGPASGYAPIPSRMQAYFSYANAKGGVNGRKIIFK